MLRMHTQNRHTVANSHGKPYDLLRDDQSFVRSWRRLWGRPVMLCVPALSLSQPRKLLRYARRSESLRSTR